jgi:hypothetical protein
MLLEARSTGGPTRPDEAIPANNRRRKTYSALYTMQELLDYYRERREEIANTIAESALLQKSNSSAIAIVFRGSYDVPAFPAPHPGESPPPDEPAEGSPRPATLRIRPDRRAVRRTASGRPLGGRPPRRPRHQGAPRGRRSYFVPMTQELRGLIPLLLDGEAAEPMVAARRIAC